MYAREKVSGTIVKRRRLCGCKRLGEVIINVKLNSNIWIRDPDVWNPCMHEYNGDLRGVIWKRACYNVYTLNKVRLIWIWDTDGRHHFATLHSCMDTLSNWRWWVAFASHIYIYTPIYIYIIFYIFLYCVRVTLTLKDGGWMRRIRQYKDGKPEHYWPLDIIYIPPDSATCTI